jgi:TANFOR domain-containing protein
MYSHFKVIVILIVAVLFRTTLVAQPYPVTITIAVTPPYSPHISDYIGQPRKIMATLVNTVNEPVSVYLQGSVTGENGIRVYTDPAYKMPAPVYLSPMGTYFISQSNLEQVFNADHLKYEGISKNEIVNGNGLPEGDYVICLRAYNYTTGVPVSAEEPGGCSAPFSVTSVEPPVILQPVCGTEINPTTPQQVMFSWTRPPNAPVNTQYQLKIIEVLPGDRNINDAMQSATHPVFFEKVVPVTNYLLGPADPALVKWKKYAFMVTALDPSKKTVFRNNGMSEVCSFDYALTIEVMMEKKKDTTQHNNLGLLQQQFNLVPRTVIKGRLLAKFPSNPNGTISMMDESTGTGKVNLTEGAGTMTYGGGYSMQNIILGTLGIQGDVTNNNLGYGNPFQSNNGAPPELNDYGGPMLGPMNAKKFIFADKENLNNTKPLPNTLVNLVVRVAVLNKGTFGQDMPSEYGGSFAKIRALDLNNAYRGDGSDFINVTIASTYTDEQGNYTFDFQSPFFTGPCIAGELVGHEVITTPVDPLGELGGLFPGSGWDQHNTLELQNLNIPGIGGGGNTPPTPSGGGTGGGGGQQLMSMQYDMSDNGGYFCLKVEVENQKFCSPDIDIFAMPGATMDLPVQVARLKTYDLTVEVKSSDKKNQLNGAGKPLAGVNVNIFRDTSSLQYEMPLILNYEGQMLKTNTFNSDGAFRNVAAGKTKADGKLLIKHLVRHDQIDPQYLISLKTRDSAYANTSYDHTFYNYESIFEELETNASTKAVMKHYPKVVYNHEYTSPTPVTLTYTMLPLDPEIKGRLMVASNLQNAGMSGLYVYLENQPQGNTTYSNYWSYLNSHTDERSTLTNDAGIFRFIGLPVNETSGEKLVKGPYRRVVIWPTGYKRVIIPPLPELPYNLSYGQLKDVGDINLEADQMMTGNVQDEEGKRVPSYVKTTISPWFKTVKELVPGGQGQGMQGYSLLETFEVPTPFGGAVLSVAPLSSEYFPRDTSVSNPTQKIIVTVYKRLHRPAITVKNDQGATIAGATVEIGGYTGTTNSHGQVTFKFPAASDQFVLKITPSDDYVPLQEAINVPATAVYLPYTYVVKKARIIQGRITDKISGTPIGGGMVYSELKQTDGIPLYLTATSDPQGYYILKGVPSNLKELPVHVVKEGGNPTYEGLTETLNLKLVAQPGQKVNYNFALKPILGWSLADIWGFPVTIESFKEFEEPGQPKSARISGYFRNPPPVNGFTLLKPDQKLPFKNLTVVQDAQHKTVPSGNSVVLEVLDIPVNIRQTFTGHVGLLVKTGTGYNLGQSPGKTIMSRLSLTKAGFPADIAGIRGQVEMNLNSFKIANQFDGILYMGDDTTTARAVVFANQPVPGTGDRHYIFSLGSSLQPVPVMDYTVFNFNADADLGLSVLEGTEVRLRTILHTSIQGCATCAPLDLKIRAGDLVITGNQITFQASPSEKLNFQLEKWKVTSQSDWTWDKNEESIIIPEAVIATPQGIQAKVVNMKIRPTYLSEGTISLSGGLSLGGIADMVLSGTLKPIFNYDAGVGHYRISVVGQTGQAAATISGLPNTVPSTLEFKSIGLLSNDETVMTIGQKYRFFDRIDMYVDQVMSGPGFFKLNGQPDPGILQSTWQSCVMSYTMTHKKLIGKMDPLKGFVECSGNVEFHVDEVQEAQTLKPGVLTAFGNVKINPGLGQSGPPVYLRGLLTKNNDSCSIRIIKVDNQKLYEGGILQKMTVGNNVINVLGGSTRVTGPKWENLRYAGNTSAVEGLNDPSKDPNIMLFEVKGAIDISSNDISVTNVSTPLGALSMVYNFDEPSFTGTLTMNNVDMGFAAINYGMMGIRFDPKGYYLAFVGDINLSAYGQYAGGFIVGNTSHVLIEHSGPLLDNFLTGYRPQFANGGPIKGFYAIGERVIVDKSFSLVVSVAAKAGLGAYVTADFSSAPTFIVGGYGYAKFSSGVDIGLCCFCMCSGAMFDIHGGIQNGNWVISNCAVASFDLTLCAVTLDADFKMDVGYNNGLYIDVGLGTCGGGSVPGPCE